MDQDQELLLAEMNQIKEFYHQFSMKCEVFDPLDRPIPNADEDCAIKSADLAKLIEEMPTMHGWALIVPLNNEKHRKLEQMFNAERNACTEIVENYQTDAKNKGLEFVAKLKENPRIKDLLDILEFFSSHALLADAKK